MFRKTVLFIALFGLTACSSTTPDIEPAPADAPAAAGAIGASAEALGAT